VVNRRVVLNGTTLQHASVASVLNQIQWDEYISIEDLREMRALDKHYIFSQLFCVMHSLR